MNNNNYNVSFEQLDIPYMCCHFFVHVTENDDFVGDYLIPDENSANGRRYH